MQCKERFVYDNDLECVSVSSVGLQPRPQPQGDLCTKHDLTLIQKGMNEFVSIHFCMNEKSDVSSQPRENLFGLFIFFPIVCAHILHHSFPLLLSTMKGLQSCCWCKRTFLPPFFPSMDEIMFSASFFGGKEEKEGSCKGHHKPAAVYQEKWKQIKKKSPPPLPFTVFPPFSSLTSVLPQPTFLMIFF